MQSECRPRTLLCTELVIGRSPPPVASLPPGISKQNLLPIEVPNIASSLDFRGVTLGRVKSLLELLYIRRWSPYDRARENYARVTDMSNIVDLESPTETPKPSTDVDDAASVKSASPAVTITSNGLKRKRTTEPKFYAVRVGFNPGIYHSWADCLKQVKGFKQAMCRYCAILE